MMRIVVRKKCTHLRFRRLKFKILGWVEKNKNSLVDMIWQFFKIMMTNNKYTSIQKINFNWMATASVIIYHMLVYKFVQKLFLQLKKMILSPTSYCQLLSTSNISNVQDLLVYVQVLRTKKDNSIFTF